MSSAKATNKTSTRPAAKRPTAAARTDEAVIKRELKAFVKASADDHSRQAYDRWAAKNKATAPGWWLVRHYGSFPAALRAAGIDAEDSLFERRWTDKERIDAIRRASQWQLRRRQPRLNRSGYQRWRESLADPNSVPAFNPISREQFAELCEAAGVDYFIRGLNGMRTYTEDDLLNALRAAAADMDGSVSQTRYLNWRPTQPVAPPDWSTIVGHFGSWAAACEAAGVQTGSGGFPVRHDDKSIRAALKQAMAEKGVPLTRAAYETWASEEEGRPSSSTVLRHFGLKWAELPTVVRPPRGAPRR